MTNNHSMWAERMLAADLSVGQTLVKINYSTGFSRYSTVRVSEYKIVKIMKSRIILQLMTGGPEKAVRVNRDGEVTRNLVGQTNNSYQEIWNLATQDDPKLLQALAHNDDVAITLEAKNAAERAAANLNDADTIAQAIVALRKQLELISRRES